MSMTTHYMPRLLIRPSVYTGKMASSGTTNIYVQNNYGSGGCSTGGLWNGYAYRNSSYNCGTPVTMDPRYYTMAGTGYNCCGGSWLPSWAQKAVENSFIFSMLENVFGKNS